jgi:hypothetical protein
MTVGELLARFNQRPQRANGTERGGQTGLTV